MSVCVCSCVWLWRMLSTKANSKLHADCIAHVDDEADDDDDDDDDTLGRQRRATPEQAVSCIHCMHKANGNVP